MAPKRRESDIYEIHISDFILHIERKREIEEKTKKNRNVDTKERKRRYRDENVVRDIQNHDNDKENERIFCIDELRVDDVVSGIRGVLDVHDDSRVVSE